jgi:hypothetical protein
MNAVCTDKARIRKTKITKSMRGFASFWLVLAAVVAIGGLFTWWAVSRSGSVPPQIPPVATSITPSPTATSTVNSGGTIPDIQQLNAPGDVSLQQGDVAEIRNESFYFTLQSLSSVSATIQITPVGCWNSFPSDGPSRIHCMLAPVAIPLQTLSVGQTYSTPNYGITLLRSSNTTATFSVSASPTPH